MGRSAGKLVFLQLADAAGHDSRDGERRNRREFGQTEAGGNHERIRDGLGSETFAVERD